MMPWWVVGLVMILDLVLMLLAAREWGTWGRTRMFLASTLGMWGIHHRPRAWVLMRGGEMIDAWWVYDGDDWCIARDEREGDDMSVECMDGISGSFQNIYLYIYFHFDGSLILVLITFTLLRFLGLGVMHFMAAFAIHWGHLLRHGIRIGIGFGRIG
jgi:hypothetical protein